jgi:hypothetical protein
MFIVFNSFSIFWGSPWSWSYGSWIYYYLCNSTNDEMYRIQHFVTKFVSDLQQIGGFLRVLGFSSVNKTGKNMIFWRKILIFHTKYPKNFRSAQFFYVRPPLTWNPGSAPALYVVHCIYTRNLKKKIQQWKHT